jgi:hypothetical protein
VGATARATTTAGTPRASDQTAASPEPATKRNWLPSRPRGWWWQRLAGCCGGLRRLLGREGELRAHPAADLERRFSRHAAGQLVSPAGRKDRWPLHRKRDATLDPDPGVVPVGGGYREHHCLPLSIPVRPNACWSTTSVPPAAAPTHCRSHHRQPRGWTSERMSAARLPASGPIDRRRSGPARRGRGRVNRARPAAAQVVAGGVAPRPPASAWPSTYCAGSSRPATARAASVRRRL